VCACVRLYFTNHKPVSQNLNKLGSNDVLITYVQNVHNITHVRKCRPISNQDW